MIFADDDISFERRTIEAALMMFDTQKDVGACGFAINIKCESGNIALNECGLITPFWFPREEKRNIAKGIYKVFTVRNVYVFDRETFFKVGGWDENIFMNGEEPDIFYRLYHHGKKVLFLNTVAVSDLSPDKATHKVIKEIGLARESVGVRNMLYSEFKLLSFPMLIAILPISLFIVALTPFFPGTLFEKWAGIRMFFGSVDQAADARASYPIHSFRRDIKLFFSLLVCERIV